MTTKPNDKKNPENNEWNKYWALPLIEKKL
jgi:hypothetical protein